MGAVEPGNVFISLGTSGVYFVVNLTFLPSPYQGFHAFCHCIPNTWHQMGVNLWQSAFQTEVQGTTGAGDSAFAESLAELLQGSGPFQTLKMACAVGAWNVEDADSVRGILTRKEILKRIDQGWQVSSEVLPS